MASSKPALIPTQLHEAQHVRLPAVERRQQLVQVAIDLFSRKGFSGTTTREIAAAAGVTEAVIFRHFKTKEQLYTAIIDQRFASPDTAAWIGEFRAAMDSDDDEAVIRQLIDAVICTHKADPKFERLMLYAALEGNEIALIYLRQVTAAIVEWFRSYFLRRQKNGVFRAISPEAALLAICGMAQQFAVRKYVHGLQDERFSDAEAVESFTQIAMGGLCAKRTA